MLRNGQFRSLLLAAGGAALLVLSTIGAEALSQHSLLWTRTLSLTVAAVIGNVSLRRRESAIVAVLHLAAIQSGATDLMASGTWATGWGSVDSLTRLSPTLLALSVLTASTISMPVPSAPRALWALAPLSGILGTTVTRAPSSALAWAILGTFLALLGLMWALRLGRVIAHSRLPDPAAAEWRWPLAVFATLASMAISRSTFEGVPHVPDEVAYWFQARYFALGHLSVPSPPDWQAFALPHTLNEGGRWYSIFPPAWPALLAVGMRLGAPTWINPLVAGATVLTLFAILKRRFDVRTANIACALLAASPMFLLMSAGLMSHPLAALCTLIVVGALHQGLTTGSAKAALATGAALGVLALTRPFEGVLVSTVVAAYALIHGRRVPTPNLLRSCALAAVAAIAIGGLLLPYHFALTGNAFEDPITRYFDALYYPGSNRLGFGNDVGNVGWGNDLLPGHTPVEAALNAQLTTQLMNLELLGWPLGSFAGIGLYAAWRRAWSFDDLLFVGIAAITVLGQAFYWYSGADYGARYWYQALIPGIVLSAKAISDWSRVNGAAVVKTAMVLSMVGLVILLPWRAATKYAGYRGMSDAIVRLAEGCDMRGGLVFVRGAGEPAPFSAYSMAAIINPPDLRGPAPVFAREPAPAIARQLQAAFPERPVWVIEPPADPRGDARVITSPQPNGHGCAEHHSHD